MAFVKIEDAMSSRLVIKVPAQNLQQAITLIANIQRQDETNLSALAAARQHLLNLKDTAFLFPTIIYKINRYILKAFFLAVIADVVLSSVNVSPFTLMLLFNYCLFLPVLEKALSIKKYGLFINANSDNRLELNVAPLLFTDINSLGKDKILELYNNIYCTDFLQFTNAQSIPELT